MGDKTIKKTAWNGEEVEIVGGDYVEGDPEHKDDWRKKLSDREQMLHYLKTGERYWYSKEWYGSEKRKTPA